MKCIGDQRFYASVLGYTTTEMDMGGYSDYCMNSPDDNQTKSGICHARGGNKDIPPMWLVYFYVADLDASLKSLNKKGGKSYPDQNLMVEVPVCNH
ncbi:MAG: hypothetical protein IPO16_09905 [Saprospiraceae bacterium]|nr:hypothetical protein [Saprospiraceae bacterium]